jgi:hypothetical protein
MYERVPLAEQISPHAWDKPITNTPGIFAVAGKAFAQGSLLDEDAHGESAKDQRQNKKTKP